MIEENKDLFKYELAIVAILKNEAPYVKEWIDYHLLAGVDHFYLYDNESEDNLKKVLQSYIENGIVDYIPYPGKCALMATYNDAVKNYKFDCQYIAFIDGDEFIFPKNNKSIKEILYEFLENDEGNENIAGLAINWHLFASSGLEKADLTKGVIERFVYRTPDNYEVDKHLGNAHVKTINNPRYVKCSINSHFRLYFDGAFAINELKEPVYSYFTESSNTNKIVINHYQTKSKEEYVEKIRRGNADFLTTQYKMDSFYALDKESTIYDDGILKYKAVRQGMHEKQGGYENIKQINQRRLNALIKILSPFFMYANLSMVNNSKNIFAGKMVNFLTCWAVSRDLKTTILNEEDSKFLEELSLKCLYKALISGSVEIWQLQLLIDELPNILTCKYPVVNDIKEIIKSFIPQLMNHRRMQNNWLDYKHLEYILQMLNI